MAPGNAPVHPKLSSRRALTPRNSSERLLRTRSIASLLAAATVALAVACGGGTSSTPTPDADAAELSPTVSPTAAPTATSAPSPTARPEPTATPRPEPEETPLPETESVNFYLRGYNQLSTGDFADAERTFNTVTELEPNFARGWDGLGQAKMLQGGFEEAMHDFDMAIRLKPNLAAAFSHRSISRLAVDDVEGAGRDARQATRLDAELVEPYIILGRVYARDGNLENSLDNFNKAVELAPDDASTYWWRGRFYRDLMRDGNRALADLNTAIELSPARASIYLDRAVLYLRGGGGLDLVRADLEEAISLAQDPRLPDIIDQAEELLKVVEESEAAQLSQG